MLVSLSVLTAAACSAADVGGPGPGPGPNPSAADTTLIVIDNATTYQVVDGFGATTISLNFTDGDHLGPYRSAAIKVVYGDLGLSLGTIDFGLVETPANATDLFGQRANDNADPMVANPAGFNYSQLDEIRNKVLIPAAAYGFSDLTLGPFISLPYKLSWMLPIRTADYSRYLDEAAENVLVTLQHWRDAYGQTPKLISLFNEPTSGNTELAGGSTQEVVDLVKRVGDRLRAAGFASIKFLVPNEETMARSYQVAQAILADPAARQYVGAIGYHGYPYGSVYSSPRRILETSGNGTPDPAARQEMEQLKALGQQYGVPIWMTEITEGPGNADYSFDAIETILARAIHIHDNFEYAGGSAFFGMNELWDSKSNAEHFAARGIAFLSDHSSIALVDVGTGAILTTGMGFAIGHYAYWVKPGALRIGASSAKPKVIATAFRDQVNKRLILVAVNNEAGEQLLRVSLHGAAANGEVTGDQTNGVLRRRIIQPFAAEASDSVNFVAPGRSVITLVIPIA